MTRPKRRSGERIRTTRVFSDEADAGYRSNWIGTLPVWSRMRVRPFHVRQSVNFDGVHCRRTPSS